MPRVLPNSLVAEARRLLTQGELSYRQIAVQVGISRGSVANISSGRQGFQRPSSPPPSPKPPRLRPMKPSPDSPEDGLALDIDLDGEAGERYQRLHREKNREHRCGLI